MKRGMALLVCLLFVISFTSATIYHVTQNGGVGSNPLSVAQFNNLDGDYSDDIFYFSGQFSSTIEVNVYGTLSYPVILDGYEPDDTRFMNLNEDSGRAKVDTNGGGYGIHVNGAYIDIVDFEVTDCSSAGIEIGTTSSSHDIKVKRSYVHEMSSGIQLYNSYNVVLGGSLGQGNVLKNLGDDTSDEDVSITGDVHDAVISYNHLYADDPAWGIDGITFCCDPHYDFLIEYNSIHGHNEANPDGGLGEDGIDIKRDVHNVIIRYNEIYDNDEAAGINLNNADGFGPYNIYIYGNSLHDNEWAGVQTNTQATYDNIYIFSNLIYSNEERGIVLQGSSANYWVFNNVFAENSDMSPSSTKTHITNLGTTAVVKNNIFYKGRPGMSDYRQLYLDTWSDTITNSDYNQYYWPNYESTIYWGDAGTRTLSQIKSGSGNGLPQEIHSSEGNPGLVDIDGNDYQIISESSAVVANPGQNMASAYGGGNPVITTLNIAGTDYPVRWDAVLHPSTDWTTTPPTVVPANQDDFGSWERGAYVYTGDPVPTYQCTGSMPSNAIAFDSEESTGLTANTPWTFSATDSTSVKCQYHCNTGYNWDGSACVAQSPSQTVYNWVEAEDFLINSPMQIGNDALASGGFYIGTPAETSDTTNPSTEASYSFNIAETDNYRLWARIYGPDLSSDGVYVGFDSNFDRIYPVSTGAYEWVGIEETSGSGDFEHSLASGNHNIVIGHGEAQARVDVLLFTNNLTFVPTGIISQGSTCTSGADSNGDSFILITELINYIGQWKSGNVGIGDLINAIGEWKAGCD